MTTKPSGGGRVKALVVGPLKKKKFFAASRIHTVTIQITWTLIREKIRAIPKNINRRIKIVKFDKMRILKNEIFIRFPCKHTVSRSSLTFRIKHWAVRGQFNTEKSSVPANRFLAGHSLQTHPESRHPTFNRPNDDRSTSIIVDTTFNRVVCPNFGQPALTSSFTKYKY